MIPPETLALFFLAAAALALSPGPDNLYVLTQSALYGRAAGWFITAGLCSGLLAHTALVALGVTALLQTSPLAFSVLKSAGAIYLLLLAWQALRAGAIDTRVARQAQPTPLGYYRRGILMNLSNPKVALFFLALLPQFADPARGSLSLQIVILGCVFLLAAGMVFGAIALLAGHLGAWLQRARHAQRVLHWLTAAVLAALAVRLLLSGAPS